MKLRHIGLVALLATALLASVGAGSALATETTLCKSSGESPYCQTAERYPEGTALEAKFSSGTATTLIKTSFGNISCTETVLSGKTSAAAGSPLPVSITGWTASGCNLGATKCQMTAESTPYSGSLSWSSGYNGTLTIASGGKGNPGWYVQCGESIDCKLRFSPTADVEGGKPGKLAVRETAMTLEKGLLCPKSATYVPTTYTIKAPEPVYVAQAVAAEQHLRFCSTTQYGEGFCPTASTYPFGTTVKTVSTSFKIATSVSNITCGKVSMSFQTQAIGAEPFPLKMTSYEFENCSASGLGQCSITASNLSTGSLEKTSPSSAEFIVDTFHWNVSCGEFFQCTYTPPLYGHAAFGAEETPPSIKYSGPQLHHEAGGLCPQVSTLEALFTMESPTPLRIL